MWEDLAQILPSDVSWILGGDWNMNDQVQDGNGRSQSIVTRHKSEASKNLRARLGLEDHFSNNHHIRFYSCGALFPKEFILQYNIRRDSTLSYHFHVAFEVSLHKVKKQQATYKMNASLFSHREVQEAISALWRKIPQS